LLKYFTITGSIPAWAAIVAETALRINSGIFSGIKPKTLLYKIPKPEAAPTDNWKPASNSIKGFIISINSAAIAIELINSAFLSSIFPISTITAIMEARKTEAVNPDIAL